MLGYLDWLLTASVLLTIASFGAVAFKRFALASVGFLALGSGALALVWDDWSARAGHHMELTALLHPVALSSREALLLVTHAPLLVLGIILLSGLSPRHARPPLHSSVATERNGFPEVAWTTKSDRRARKKRTPSAAA